MHTLFLLAQPVRWRIIEILATGEHTSGQIADAVQRERGVGREAVSKHLSTLARAGLVISRADENARVYRMSPRVLGALAALIRRILELREGSQYDDLDIDGRDYDIGAEPLPSLGDHDPELCWCILRSGQIESADRP